MFLYNLLITLIYLGIFIHIFAHKYSLEKKLYCIISTLIVGMIGLRHETLGTDTYNYLQYFLNPDSMTTYYGYGGQVLEPMYELVNRVVGLFTSDKYVYLFVSAVMSLVPVMLLIWKYSKNPFLSLFLFVSFSVGMSLFFLSFSMVRQFMAIGFWALVVDRYMENNRQFNKSIWILIICMVLTHKSSAMVAVLFLLDRYEIKRVYYIAAILFTAVLGKLSNVFFPILETVAMQSDMSFYLTSTMEEQTYSIFPKIPYILTYVYIAYSTSSEYCNSFWMKGLFLAICMANTLTYGTNIERMCAYFYVVSFIAIVNAIGYKKIPKPAEIIFMASLFCYFTYKYYLTFDIMEGTMYILSPYRSCFE